MAIITYAQNFEDVLLDRVFGGKRRGFYVDVGAAHPEILSVTKHFYSLGWHGISIEPNPEMHALLVAQRPRDINLCLALGSRFDVREFFQAAHPEASSFDQEAAQKQSGSESPKSYMVEIRTLAEICRQFCDEPIDFLKIDVEGFEREVLEGADFTKYRPVVIVLESIKPFGGCTWKTVEDSKNTLLWEDILIQNEYQSVYFDGLNSFYIRKEDIDLRAAFSIPVSFRDFILPVHSNLESSQLKLLPPAQAKIYEQVMALKESAVGKAKELDELTAHHSKVLADLEASRLRELEELRVTHSKMLSELDADKSKELEELRAAHSKALSELEADKSRELEELKVTHSKMLSELEASKSRELEELKVTHSKMLSELEASKSRELENLKLDYFKRLGDIGTQKSREFTEWKSCHTRALAELEMQRTEEIERFEANSIILRERIDQLHMVVSECEKTIDNLRTELARSKDEIKRLQGEIEAGRRVIYTLDEKARNNAMAMHARDACISWWRRPFFPKLALPLIGEPIKLKASSKSEAALSPPNLFTKKSVPSHQAASSAPVLTTMSPDPKVSNRRMPGSFHRYPDRTGHRLAEGGRRLNGEVRTSQSGKPLVTIVTTVRNGDKYLVQCMNSVFSQTYPNIEYIIVDGASTDMTLDLIKKFEAKIDYFVSEPDSGLYAGMNKGIELAYGEYILLLNADDCYLPDAVEKLVRIAEASGADLTAGDSRNVDAENKDMPPSLTSGLSRSSWTPLAYIICPLKHEITLVHKNVYKRYGLYDENLKVCADWKWMAKIYDDGRCRVELIREPLLIFRKDGLSSNETDVARHWQERLDVIAMFFPDVEVEDLPHVLRLTGTREVIQRLKRKYPLNSRLQHVLDIRTQGWHFATGVSDEGFDPNPLPFTSMLPTPRVEPLCAGGLRSISYPGRWVQYPDLTGQRRVEGGRRLLNECSCSNPDALLVTIITTVRNGEKHLVQCMESVCTQTYPSIEYIIIDGASTDNTLELIKGYEDKIDYFISEPDSGIYAGMNKGIELARGDFILILNADDYLLSPDVIACLVEQTRNEAVDVVLGSAQRLDAKDQNVGSMHSTVDARLFLRCTVVHEAMLVSKETYRNFGLYNESFKVVSDWAWMRRVLPQIRYRVINKDILAHRSIGVSTKDDIKTAQEKYQLIAPDILGLTWEDYYPARYPHHLTSAESNALATKYPDCAALRAALALFSETNRFDPIEYWKKRHEDLRADSRAVGMITLSKQENDRIYSDFNKWLASFIQQIFPPSIGRKRQVLDIGCGVGMNAQVFQENGWEYCGVDISGTAIEQARVRAPSGEYRLHDLSSSPLPEWEGRFDCVFIRTVLIHVVEDSRWSALLQHATRLLNETGKFMIIDSIPDQRQSPAKHVVFRSLDEYRTIVGSLGMILECHERETECLVISQPEQVNRSGKSHA